MAMFSLRKKILLSLLTGTLIASFATPVAAARSNVFGMRPRTPSHSSSSGMNNQFPTQEEHERRRPTRSSTSRPSGPRSGRTMGGSRPSNVQRPSGQRPSGPLPGRTMGGSRPSNVQRPSGQRPSGPPPNRQAGMNRPSGPRPSNMSRPNGPFNGNMSRPNNRPYDPRPYSSSRPPNAPQHGPEEHRPSYSGSGPKRPPSFGHGPSRPPRNDRHDRHYRSWRHNRFIFDFGWPRRYYWWGTNHHVHFGDYLLLVLILQAIQNANNNNITMDELYAEHNSGSSYEDICNRYNLNYSDIYARARLGYGNMHSYAIGHSLDFWGWDDRLIW